MMATTANSASCFSIDSSPWMMPAHSDAFHDDPAPSHPQDDPFSFSPPTGNDGSDSDNADKKPVWNKPSTSSAEVRHVMGAADSWPALSLSARPSSNKSPSLDSSKAAISDEGSPSSSSMPPPQVASFSC